MSCIEDKSNRKRFLSRHGFTFLEVMVTMLIISLLLTVATPSFSHIMERIKLDNDAQALAWQLKNARQQAITTCSSQLIYIYVNNHKYKLENGATTYLSSDIHFVGNTTFTQRKKGLPVCNFLPSGAPSQAGTITLANACGEKRYVIVNLAAGRIRVSSTPPESWE